MRPLDSLEVEEAKSSKKRNSLKAANQARGPRTPHHHGQGLVTQNTAMRQIEGIV
jgi:hypothetical protein